MKASIMSFKKLIFQILLLLFLGTSVNAQMKSKFNRGLFSYGFVNKVLLEDEGLNFINPSNDKVNPSGFILKSNELFGNILGSYNILSQLESNKIAAKIFKNILINNEGKLNTKYLFDMGAYNASDAEIIFSKYAKEGNSLIENSGFDILENVYILILEEFFVEYPPENKNRRISGKLFKVEINKYEFLKSIYGDDNKLDVDKIENYNYKIVSVVNKVAKDYYRLFIELGRTYKGMRVTSSVYSLNPVSAKIGKKEDISVNDLYQVLQNKKRNDNSIVVSSKGYVRVKSVANNSENASGASSFSTFYKTFSSGIDKGMILRNIPSRGLFFGASKYMPSSDKSLLSGYMYNVDYNSHKHKGLYTSIGIGLTDTTKSVGLNSPGGILNSDTTAIYSGLLLQFSINKTINLNFLEITPQFGFLIGGFSIHKLIYKNRIVDSHADEGFGATKAYSGLKIGINLGRSMQLYSSLNKILGPPKAEITATSDKVIRYLQYDNPFVFKIGLRLFGL